MIGKIKYIILLLLSCLSLSAEYNEKNILLQNAKEMIKVRKFSLAEDLYNEALTKYPRDYDVLLSVLDLYEKTNKTQEGLSLLQKKGEVLPNNLKIKYELTFLLLERKFELAYQKGENFLNNNTNTNNYQTIGTLFQRYRAYDEAIRIYTKGNDLFPNEFSYELAESHYFDRNYNLALTNYLLSLEYDKGNKSMINNRIQNIIKQDYNAVDVLISYFGSEFESLKIDKQNKFILDIYINSLLTTGHIEIALSLLQSYEVKDIYAKAEQFKRSKDYKISKMLYELLLEKSDDLNFYYRYAYNFANMLFISKSYQEADSLISIILSDDGNDRYKRNILFDSYLLKADIVHHQRDFSSSYQNYLAEARKYAINNKQKMTLNNKLCYYNLLKEDYSGAEKYIRENSKYEQNTELYFNNYLLAVFTSSSKADSLATELMIMSPEADYTLEMLDIKASIKKLNIQDRNLFLDAYRKEKLFIHEEADSLYTQLYHSTKNEYFMIKNALMNLDSENINRAKEIFSMNYEDTFARDFARMYLVIIEDEKSSLAQDMARNFLTQFPNSSFAAKVRQILMIENE